MEIVITSYSIHYTKLYEFKAQKVGTDEVVELKVAPDESVSAFVFKTVVDPFVGKISMFKVVSGEITADSTIYNSSKDKIEKLSQLFLVRGKKQIPVKKLAVGDIGAVATLVSTETRTNFV